MSRSEMGEVATIDEALENTHFGKFNYFVILFCGLVVFNVNLESVGVSFVLPILECDLQLTYQQQGVLGAVGFIGVISSSHLWGFFADTTGRKNIMQPALMLQFLSTIISSFSLNFEMLAVSRFFNGFFLSAGSATVFAYLGEFHCQKYRSRAILYAAFINAIFNILFPLMAWAFINQSWHINVPYLNINFKPWRLYLIACGVPGLICGILLCFLPESPKYLLMMDRRAEAITILKSIYRQNTKGRKISKDSNFNITSILPDVDTPIRKASSSVHKNGIVILFNSMWQQTAPLFMREHIRKTFLASLIQFIIFFTVHGVYMWFPYILNSAMQFTQHSSNPTRLCDILKASQDSILPQSEEKNTRCVTHLESSTYIHVIMSEIIYVTFLFFITYAVGKIERKFILFSTLMVCSLGGILSLIVTTPLLAVYGFIVLLCCGLGFVVVNAIVVDIYPTNLRGMAVCISMMLGRIGSVTGSNVLGVFINSHCEVALYSSACSLILAGLLGFFLPNVNKRAGQHCEVQRI